MVNICTLWLSFFLSHIYIYRISWLPSFFHCPNLLFFHIYESSHFTCIYFYLVFIFPSSSKWIKDTTQKIFVQITFNSFCSIFILLFYHFLIQTKQIAILNNHEQILILLYNLSACFL